MDKFNKYLKINNIFYVLINVPVIVAICLNATFINTLLFKLAAFTESPASNLTKKSKGNVLICVVAVVTAVSC